MQGILPLGRTEEFSTKRLSSSRTPSKFTNKHSSSSLPVSLIKKKTGKQRLTSSFYSVRGFSCSSLMGREKFLQSLGESEAITLTFLEKKMEGRKKRRRACTKGCTCWWVRNQDMKRDLGFSSCSTEC